MTEFLKFALATKVEDIRPRDTTGKVRMQKVGPVMCLASNERLPRAFNKLGTESFLSAPVLDVHRKYCGWVDMLDITKFVADLFGEDKEHVSTLWDKRQGFTNATVGDVMQSRWIQVSDPFHAIHNGFSLLYAMETFAKLGVHRVPIVDEKEDISGILTQSMVISIFRQMTDKLGDDVLKSQVSEMQLGEPVQTVRETESAITAFDKMVTQKISAVAIVNDEGILTGTLSVRDLRGVGVSGEKFRRLYQPVRDYKAAVLREFPTQATFTHYSPEPVPRSALCVTPNDTMMDIIRLMNDGNIHRIFVVDAESKRLDRPRPIQVVSQRDVIRHVLKRMGTCE